MKTLLITFVLTVTVFAIPFQSTALAADVTAETILGKMKEALEPEIASTRTLTFLIKDHGKVTNTWVAREARKKLPEGKRTLLVLIKPDEVKGLARLVWERASEMDFQWIYLPALKRMTKIAPVNSYDSFQGTDFTYSDFGFVDISGTHKLLDEADLGGTKVYRVETIPEETWYYSKIITWVSKDTFLPLKRDLYDVTGELWKTQHFDNVTVINNIPTPLLVRMENVQSRTGTDYSVSEVCYGAGLPDEIFVPRGLTNALEYDFCPLPTPAP